MLYIEIGLDIMAAFSSSSQKCSENFDQVFQSKAVLQFLQGTCLTRMDLSRGRNELLPPRLVNTG